MKRIIIFIFLLLCFYIYADSIYSPFNYSRLTSEPVNWYPEPGIYNNSIYLALSSEYGKIFYVIGKNFNNTEPREYTKEIILKGKDGGVVDYDIIVILEKENANVELYSRTYRIDRTNRFVKKYYKKKEYYKKSVSYNNEKIKIKYNFVMNDYGITFKNREFIFPQNISYHQDTKETLELKGEKLEKSMYLVNLSYMKEDKIFTEVHSYSIYLASTQPPSFGTLYWGQIYRQSYEIRIKPAEPEDTIYYWKREWQKDDYIVGPPLQTKRASWKLYKEPIELTSKYGKDGTTGIAAFSIGKNGGSSKVAGPYYFKIMDIDDAFEQMFENKSGDRSNEKMVMINGHEYKNRKIITDGKANLSFKNFDKDDRFYFTFESRNKQGKSELLLCEGEYIFKNIEKIPVEFKLYLSNGEKVGAFKINGQKMILPIMKKYSGNYVNVSEDTIIDFFMPNNLVKYEASSNIKKYLDISEESPEFSGSIKISANEGEEKKIKIKFGAFDKNNNLIGETDDFYFKIDKKKPNQDVSSDGVDFKIFHNEKQILKLIPSEKDAKIYYRLSNNNEWTLYEQPIAFYPPLYSKFSASVYTKSVDEAGNERENTEPFVILFDTRAIFVDAKKKFSGNGTESSPYNSIERAIKLAKKKNIKLIYISSDVINVSFPIKIDSDIIIQPYKKNTKPMFIMDTKSIWRKKHIWFDISKDGYFELRNIDFKIKSGSYFANITKSKMKLYNLNFSYTGKDDFCFIKNNGGKLGINNFDLNITNYPEKFNFLDTSYSNNILKDLRIKATGEEILFFNINKALYFTLDWMILEVIADQSINFINLDSSNISLGKIIYKQTGDFKNSILYDIKDSNLYIEDSDFISEGKKSFEVKVLEQKNSYSKIIKSLFWIKNSASVIGFNSYNSDINFEKSLFNAQDILDYVYNFRGDNSNIKFYSSVIRNLNCKSAVSFVIKDGNFEGANNSIFNINIAGRGFNFWVTNKAQITTVNSLYYFNKQNETNAFIYLNNKDYNLLKPIWYSNAVSSNIVLLENLEKKDSSYIIKDFIEKNLYYNFTDEFNIESAGFFIPLADSPLLQGGLPEYSSPITIPEKDFFGRNRMIQGLGIDIGAVQKSGNF